LVPGDFFYNRLEITEAHLFRPELLSFQDNLQTDLPPFQGNSSLLPFTKLDGPSVAGVVMFFMPNIAIYQGFSQLSGFGVGNPSVDWRRCDFTHKKEFIPKVWSCFFFLNDSLIAFLLSAAMIEYFSTMAPVLFIFIASSDFSFLSC